MSSRAPQSVAELIERIDATWRDWVTALDQVAPSDDSIAGVCGHWPVKIIAAHITHWESRVFEYLQRAELGLDRRPSNVEKINQLIESANESRAYELILAAMFATHHQVREAILHLSDPVAADLMTNIANETWDHYPEHALQVQDWAGARKARSRNGSAAYSASWEATMDALAGIPEHLRAETRICGDWTAHDVLGNLAYWDGIHIRELEDKAGIKPFTENVDDYVTLNTEQAAIRASWSWDEIVAEARQNHDRLMVLLEDPGEEGLKNAIHEHWDEHRAQIERWFQDQG